jgi:hypothetical protein
MDGTGQTPDFYLCFSDLGGPVRFTVASGQQTFERDLTVDPEPYLLRVKAEPKDILEGSEQQGIFTIDAYDIDSQPIKISVDLDILDDKVLQLLPGEGTVSTPGPGDPSTIVQVFAVGKGATQLNVSPLLLAEPHCLSDIVTVELPPPTQ